MSARSQASSASKQGAQEKKLLNKKAPDFTLPDQQNQATRLKDFRGQWVLLYFYPRALTPGCTVQAVGIRDHQAEFAALDCVVLGVSADTPSKLTNFENKYELNFRLLSDPDHTVCNAYGVYGEKKMMGKTSMGIKRHSFVIDPAGKVRAVIEKVTTKTHHDDMLMLLRELQAE